ncbi:hypothetical protein [Novosphingobium sp. KA1]|uniref:hypothetical protein n=1 Tax=Novosphingobium sp. (strain KA1) TaxID=164608 RepID=UPI001A8C3B61|nr:hypothetical protein [Novosphingobium sp. KA1]QSR16062.1 hypothetical protein CA833_02425 [Novosphingobium sp. KA1]
MSKKTLATGTSPFAHLLSGFRGAKRAEDDEPEIPEGEETEEERAASEDDEQPDDEAKKARRARKAKRAEDDDEDQDPEADDGDEDEIGAEEDMDEDERKAFRQGVALGRARENSRCARIFRHQGAGPRPDLAATLAFGTRNSSAEAGRILGTVGEGKQPRGSGLDARMNARREARPGADVSSSTSSKPNFGERVAAAVKKAGR